MTNEGGRPDLPEGVTDMRRPPDADGAGQERPEIVDPRSDRSADVESAPAVESAPLLSGEESGGYRTRWEEIQVGFVDRPRDSVQAADALVAEVMRRLAEGFARERSRLEGQWDRGDEVSTEDLRVALRRYRSFFQRLLAA